MLTPTFTAPDIADIIDSASQIFNPFVPIIALVLGVSLGLRLLMRVANMW